MKELFRTKIVANVEECRMEACLWPVSVPEDEEPWAMVYELERGWCFELPYDWDEEIFPFQKALEALEDAADVLETYPNHVGVGAPEGAGEAELRRWLLRMEQAS